MVSNTSNLRMCLLVRRAAGVSSFLRTEGGEGAAGETEGIPAAADGEEGAAGPAAGGGLGEQRGHLMTKTPPP